jgi:integrase
MGVYKRPRKPKKGEKQYWYIRYLIPTNERKPNGKIRYIDKSEAIGPCGQVTKSMAEIVLADRLKKIHQGKLDELIVEIPTLKEFSEEHLEYLKKVKLIRSYRRSRECINHFLRAFPHKRLNEIHAEDIDSYKAARLREGVKLGTVARELRVLKHLFNRAIKNRKLFGDNPVTKSGIPNVNDQKERILKPDEEERLLASIRSIDLYHAVQLAITTGMREMEILGHEFSWVNWESRYTEIPQTNTKSGEKRKIRLKTIAYQILLERRKLHPTSKYVFPSDSTTGHLMSVKTSWRAACRRAGIYDLRFHDLRHTAATRMLEKGIPLQSVAKILGHSSTRTTERYGHPDDSVDMGLEVLDGYSQKVGQKLEQL